jgi:hypothetical protein
MECSLLIFASQEKNIAGVFLADLRVSFVLLALKRIRDFAYEKDMM